MYTVIKRMEISAAHSLSLSYPSKCEYLHGHNWIITVHCRSKELNTDGMVIDFTHITGTSTRCSLLTRQPRISPGGYATSFPPATK